MNDLRVMCVFGTRPEATKMSPVIKELQSRAGIQPIVCVTGQHREMLDTVLGVVNIRPDYDLNIMQKKQTLADVTTRCLNGLPEIFREAKPDIILVHGDPTTSFAAALAAFYANIKVGHVEAGLRSYDKYQPYPEEMNRLLTGRLADIHFAPTQISKENLIKENILSENIYVTGNTSVDLVRNTVKPDYRFRNEKLNKIINHIMDCKPGKRMITMTAHRFENLGEPFVNICNTVLSVVNDFEDVELVWPVHMNPAVRDIAFDILSGYERIHLLEPVDFQDLQNLMSRSYMLLTDSGGLQEEAASMKLPCIVLRNVTERPEGLESGSLILGGVTREGIYQACRLLLTDRDAHKKMKEAKNPYGDGYAARRIADAVSYHFGLLGERPEDFV